LATPPRNRLARKPGSYEARMPENTKTRTLGS